MTTSEIKGSMSQGKWHQWNIKPSVIVLKNDNGFEKDFVCDSSDANAAAICNAINSTYGAGIDPLKIGEAVDTLKEIAAYFTDVDYATIPFDSRDIERIKTLLTALKLKP